MLWTAHDWAKVNVFLFADDDPVTVRRGYIGGGRGRVIGDGVDLHGIAVEMVSDVHIGCSCRR